MGTFGVAFTKQSQISERETLLSLNSIRESPTFISAVLRQALPNVSDSATKKQIDVHNKRAQPVSPEASLMNEDEGNFVI